MTAEIPSPAAGTRDRAAVVALLDAAARTVAPLWPLDHFVAVNPFLGWTDRSFAETSVELRQLAGARLTMDRPFYQAALRDGRLTDADLEAATREIDPSLAVADIRRRIADERPPPEAAPTVVEVAAADSGQDWTQLVTERLTAWASTHFDEGAATWHQSSESAYADWRLEASIDRTPELWGAKGFCGRVAGLPEDPVATVTEGLARLGVELPQAGRYLRRLAASLGGWGGVAAFRRWEQELRGESDDTLLELIAVRVAWEVVLLESLDLTARWAEARGWLAEAPSASADDLVDQVLQRAFELGWQRSFAADLETAGAPASDERPRAQCVFCIDVRSEVFRRSLEGAAPTVETLGFAGFFGFPVGVRALGAAAEAAHCPALLAPGAQVEESIGDDTEAVNERLGLLARASAAWKSFKQSAVSCFTFVGPVGLGYAPRLLSDARGWTKPGAVAGRDALSRADRERLRFAWEEAHFPLSARIDCAEGALRGMSLTHGFARVVALIGHGSTTSNNPYGSALDCGACGGRTGEASARVAAAVLNEPAVREGLAARGIAIPDDTWFVAGLHDTTTDEVTLFDRGDVPASHRGEVLLLDEQLRWAGARTRTERAPRLHARGDLTRAVRRRSRDWSEVRPEWGLAGCAGFVAAPRSRTRGLSLEGRSFLHSYAWRDDEGFSTLELIMTAPLVVASWISLQYYASTVDNETFGSGDKTLHNVVGGIGILEGNGGALRVGLPWQSVHDGERLVHEPLRLSAYIEAPIEAMNGVLEKHPEVQSLLDHGWLHLFALDEEGKVAHRYQQGRRWVRVGDAPTARDAA